MQALENPILLLFGVLLNTSKSDAHAYVRGLLESSCKARESSWYGLTKDGDRWIYEIHEGGEGLSLLPGILAAHKEGRPNPVFRLSNNRVVEASQAGEEIFGLVMPEESFEGEATDYASFPKGKRLTPYLGDGKHYLVAGIVSLVIGVTTAVAGGLAYLASNEFVDHERIVVTAMIDKKNASLYQMNKLPISGYTKAVDSLGKKEQGAYISRLESNAAGWNWTIVLPSGEAVVEDEKAKAQSAAPAQQQSSGPLVGKGPAVPAKTFSSAN